MEVFDIATPFFYFRDEILADPRSPALLQASRAEQKRLAGIVPRFWRVVEMYGDWFPRWYVDRVRVFAGRLCGTALTVIAPGRPEFKVLLD